MENKNQSFLVMMHLDAILAQIKSFLQLFIIILETSKTFFLDSFTLF